MPQPYVKKLAKEHGVSVDAAEGRWAHAKKQAAKQGHEEDFAYITGIFKKMMGESLVEGKMSEIAVSIEDEFENYARRHGDEYTATHMDEAKTVITMKIAKAYGLTTYEARKLVKDALKEDVAPKMSFKKYLIHEASKLTGEE